VVLTTIQPLTLSAYSAAIGCLLLVIPAWQHGIAGSIPNASWQSWVAVIYMGITATALGYIWFYDAVKKLGAAQTTVVGNLTPVFAVLIAVIFLGESLTISTIIGGILVMIGILLTNGLLRRPRS
jgi:drug/metabolite transporter (DMT)-like permease